MNNQPDVPIGKFGCLLTCFAMLAGRAPDRMNWLLMANDGYVNGSGNASTFDIASSTCGQVRLIYASAQYKYTPFPESEIERALVALKAGKRVIVEVDFYPFDSITVPPQAGHQQHFVLAVGTSPEPGRANFATFDPYDGAAKMLCPRYGQSLETALIRTAIYE